MATKKVEAAQEVVETTDVEEVEVSEDALTEEDIKKEEAPVEESNITEDVAAQFEKDAIIGDAFLRRSIQVPGKKKRKTVFRDAESIVGDEGGEIETYGSLKKKEYDLLSDSAKAAKPKVLYGRIDGIEEVELAGGIKTATAVCHLITDKRSDINTDREMKSGIYKIKIPAPMLFIYDRDLYSTQEGYPALKRNLDMRVGSVVEFIVYNINADEEDVLASRIRAMQILSYDHYLGKRKDIQPGTKAKGYISYVNSSGIVVDVFGSECFIPNNELAWRFIKNPLDEKNFFHVGKAVAVRIQSVSSEKTVISGQTYPYIKTSASIKDAYENPNKMFFEKYLLGQKYSGQVGYRLITGEYIVNLGSDGDGINGDRAICICKAPTVALGGAPYVGQKCSVALIGKNQNTCRFTGVFTYLES